LKVLKAVIIKKLGIPFVYEPKNLEIALREFGDFQDEYATVRRLRDCGPQSCSKKSTDNKLFGQAK